MYERVALLTGEGTPNEDVLSIAAPGDPVRVIRSLAAPDALLAEVGRAYTIDRPQSCVLLRTFINDVYLLTGPFERHILKVYRPRWRSAEELLWEVALVQHLVSCGAPVAPVVLRRDGRAVTSLAAPEGARHAVLFQYAEGRKPEEPFTGDLYHAFGLAAAQIHKAADSFVAPHPRRSLDLFALIDAPLAAVRPFLRNRPEHWSFVRRLAADLRARIASLALQGLEWGICHQDMTLDNVHVADDGGITFYDFDSAAPGWRSLEFQGIYHASMDLENHRWDAFLAGYREAWKLAPPDADAVRYFVLAYALWGVHMDIVRAQWSGVWELDSAYFEERVGSSGWWRLYASRHLE